MAFPRPLIQKVRGGACPQTPSGLGSLWRTNFSAACTFRISRYAADYRYLYIAYEINAQGWIKRLGLEGVGGACILKIVITKGVQFSYAIIIVLFFWGGGGKVLIQHTLS